MTPQELFDADPHEPRWIHGSDIGIDQDDGLWVRSDAKLEADIPARVRAFGIPLVFKDLSLYALLTSGMVLSVNPTEPAAPIRQYMEKLTVGSIGPGWIAVI